MNNEPDSDYKSTDDDEGLSHGLTEEGFDSEASGLDHEATYYGDGKPYRVTITAIISYDKSRDS